MGLIQGGKHHLFMVLLLARHDQIIHLTGTVPDPVGQVIRLRYGSAAALPYNLTKYRPAEQKHNC